MAGVNKAIILGNLGADPEIRYTSGGQAVSDLRIATSRRWQNKDGGQQEDTQWHRVVVWGKQAEMCKEYLSKGRQVYIEGRIQTRAWDDKEGIKRYTTEIVAQTVQFVGNRGDSNRSSGGSFGGGSQGGNNSGGIPDAVAPSGPSFSDDEIPF